MTDACPNCGTTYGHLLRHDRKAIFACRNCEQQSCDSCVVRDYSLGHDMASARCPKCSSGSLDLIDLTTRFSIYSTVENVARLQHGLALPFVPWSAYPRRTEELVRRALPKLQEYRPEFILLNEDDDSTRDALATWFPARYQSAIAQGAGGLIWIKGGIPVDTCDGGPYVTEYEILIKSRAVWS